MESIIVNGIVAGVAGLQIAVLVFVLLWFLNKHLHLSFLEAQIKLIKAFSRTGAFFIALFSVLGSLFLSEVVALPPCDLCWFQRIFMYPIPVLLYLAIMRKDYAIRVYIIALSLIGSAIALYHYLIQLNPDAQILPCSQASLISCTEGYTFYFGYISIPLMSLTAFVAIILLMLISPKRPPHA